jgi:hypothetical protein
MCPLSDAETGEISFLKKYIQVMEEAELVDLDEGDIFLVWGY